MILQHDLGLGQLCCHTMYIWEDNPAVRSKFWISDGQIHNIKSVSSIRLLDGSLILRHDLGLGQLRYNMTCIWVI